MVIFRGHMRGECPSFATEPTPLIRSLIESSSHFFPARLGSSVYDQTAVFEVTIPSLQAVDNV